MVARQDAARVPKRVEEIYVDRDCCAQVWGLSWAGLDWTEEKI